MKSKVDNCVRHCLSILKPAAAVFILAARWLPPGVQVLGKALILCSWLPPGRGANKCREACSEGGIHRAISAVLLSFQGGADPEARWFVSWLPIQRIICIVNNFKQAVENVCVCGRVGSMITISVEMRFGKHICSVAETICFCYSGDAAYHPHFLFISEKSGRQ